MTTFAQKLFSRSACTGVAAMLVALSGHAAELNLQNVPLYLTTKVDPNVLINMSVETPMGGAAYNDQAGTPTGCTGRQNNVGGDSAADDIGTCYIAATTYFGYFDPNKCYDYSSSRFNPSGATTATHTCTSKWSGNFLNWATMTAIDMFILNMTGGNRVTDTTSTTVVRRARKQDNNSWFPRKAIGTAINVPTNTVTPYNHTRLFIHNTDWGFQLGTTFAAATGGSPTYGEFKVDVKVCESASNKEANCKAYGSSPVYYKPEGLIQANANSKRFGVLSYTSDNSSSRDGGVLRSNMKYVGPTLPDGSNNIAKEYGTNGILINNPEGATNGLNSGVINYINKFSTPGYKQLDPIGELFYEGIRYFKNLGPTLEYSSGIAKNSTDANSGGFWFANSTSDWQDPIQYRCQKNFVVAINDANPWYDKQLPGTFFSSNTFSGAPGYNGGVVTLDAGSQDWGQPSNPDTSINVRELTNTVGALEGLNGTSWVNDNGTGTDSVGGGPGTYNNSCDTKTVANLGEVMGTCPAPQKQNSYYIAGLAYYANTQDIRPDLVNDVINGKTVIQNVESFFIDTQEFNANPLSGNKNMLWLAGKYGSWIDTDGDGVPDPSEWDANGDGQPDNYVLATKPEKLIEGLNNAFSYIDGRTSSASSAAVNSGSVSSLARVYQATFDTTNWTGDLLSYEIDSTNGKLSSSPEWRAAAKLPTDTATRKIFTVGSETTFTPKLFNWATLSTDSVRVAQLTPPTTIPATTANDVLDYIRGVATNEGTTAGKYRVRPSKLGDIINSTPLFVGAPSFGYSDSLETADYSDFAFTSKNRTPAVYVGANDGMLHAFNATNGANEGQELFAFIPSPVFANLKNLTTQTNFTHQYFVDGSPNSGDVYYGGAWHTVLAGGLNSGGQGIYALDVTAPASFSATDVLWEFTDKNDADLGLTFSRPQIVRLKSGKWAAIFGNGYNNTFSDGASSTTGHAVLYVVDIQNGNLIKKFDTGAGSASTPNGLATPIVIDTNGDKNADFVYAGDLLGNMWKFDIRDADKDNWSIPFTSSGNPAPLYVAADANGVRQPITSRPEIARGADGVGMTILFGTGKWLELTDKVIDSAKPQTFYGIYDPNTIDASNVVDPRAAFTGRSLLGQQGIVEEKAVNIVDNKGTATTTDDEVTGVVNVRQTTSNSVGSRGWYMDLKLSSGYVGERVVSNPIVRNGRVIFSTLIPSNDLCGFGGDSWLMELNLLTGSRLTTESPYDVNQDGIIDDNDYVTFADGTTVPVSGVKSEVGITPEPGVLTDQGSAIEYKYSAGSSGQIQQTTESGMPTGRQSWRQVK